VPCAFNFAPHIKGVTMPFNRKRIFKGLTARNWISRARALFIKSLLLLWFGFPVPEFAQPFQRLNPGTRSDIRYFNMFSDSEGFLVSDKIHHLENGVWKLLHQNGNVKASLFYASAPDDYWYTINNESSTSEIFHFVKSSLTRVHSIFANEVTSISSTTPDTVLFASFSEVAFWTKEGIFMLEPLPGSYTITKLHMISCKNFWALTRQGRLFHYSGSGYQPVLPNETVRDFYMNDTSTAILCDKTIYRLNHGNPEPILSDKRLQSMMKIAVTNSETIWLTQTGKIFSIKGGVWQLRAAHPGQSFRGIFINGSDEAWIYGDHGLLLYSGKGQPKPYDSLKPGFTGHKILEFGIKADDEYGVAFADLNGDGKEEIYAVRIYNPNRLYINSMDETDGIYPEAGFSEEAMIRSASGISNPLAFSSPSELFLGVAVADVDNDGDQDIYLCSLNSRNKLLINNGKGFFRDVSHQKNRACENLNRSNAASFADVDLDGDLDIFVTSENGSNRLFINDGTGHFSDIAGHAGLTTNGGGMCSAFSDFNHDGLPDLCVSFWNAGSRLYVNETSNGKIRFTDVTANSPLAQTKTAKSNAVAFADVNNDGWPDLFVAGRNSANHLYINTKHGTFTDRTHQYFPDSVMLTNGAVFADMNLDGYPDLFLANVGGNVFFENQHGLYFNDATPDYGLDAEGYSTGCAVSDIDNDGDLDLYVSNYINENSMLYINRIDGKKSVTFNITGIRSNRDAIGSKIWLYAKSLLTGSDSLAGYREITCGEGYGSVNSKKVLFVVSSSLAYHAVVKLPSTADTLFINTIVPGTTIEVDEITGTQRSLIKTEQFIYRITTDREILMEITKYLLIIILLLAYILSNRKGYKKIFAIRLVSIFVLFALFIIINQLLVFQQSQVLFYVAPATAIIGLFLIHLITERLLLKRITENEKLHLREKIARDLHDDLASTLGTISIYADSLNAAKAPSKEYIEKLSEKISDLTHFAKQSITDIIWMTSPRNDSLQGLVVKIGSLMAETFHEADIKFTQEIQMEELPVFLKEGVRNNLFLILKEAMNNILKHSMATKAFFSVKKIDHRTSVTLTDNGKGFDNQYTEDKPIHGNGIINMHRRAAESSITFVIKSGTQKGTSIQMTF
jgi:signal transduction histidine kinase